MDYHGESAKCLQCETTKLNGSQEEEVSVRDSCCSVMSLLSPPLGPLCANPVFRWWLLVASQRSPMTTRLRSFAACPPCEAHAVCVVVASPFCRLLPATRKSPKLDAIALVHLNGRLCNCLTKKLLPQFWHQSKPFASRFLHVYPRLCCLCFSSLLPHNLYPPVPQNQPRPYPKGYH